MNFGGYVFDLQRKEFLIENFTWLKFMVPELSSYKNTIYS